VKKSKKYLSFALNVNKMSSNAVRDMLKKNPHVVVEDVTNNQNYQLVSANTSSESYTINDFKTKVSQWVQLDKELTQIKEKIKVLTQEKKQLAKMMEVMSFKILEFMSMNDPPIDQLNTRQGLIKCKRSFVKETLSKKQLIENLTKEFQNVVDADDRIINIFNNRPKVEKMKLIRKIT
jgi:hypothetical protein